MECNSGRQNTYNISTTAIKAFKIIELISRNQSMTAVEVIEALGFGRSQTHRILKTLQHVNYLRREGNKYKLSYKLFCLGNAVPISRELREVAKPFMRSLMEITKENVYLNILVDNKIVAIDEVKSSHHVKLNPDLTYSFPIHVCSSAKLLLGNLSPKQRISFVEKLNFTKETKNTVDSADKFINMIDESLSRGYALEVGEYRLDLNSVAAPIFDYRKKIVATISISGPSIRMSRTVIESYIDLLKDTALRISEALGLNASVVRQESHYRYDE